MNSGRGPRGRKKSQNAKDRLIQARVPEHLENVLKEAAQKQRLSVSHLVRNILQDTLELVDTVVSGAEELVGGSVEFAEQVRRDAGRIASSARQVVRGRTGEVHDKEASGDENEFDAEDEDAPTSDENWPGDEDAGHGAVAAEPDGSAAVERVLAWNQVVVNRSANCASCDKPLPRGITAHLGLGPSPSDAPVWLCSDCLEKL